MTVALIVANLAFAWSMGAHYTGAVMGGDLLHAWSGHR